MKQIFTLTIIIALSTFTSFTQSQNFECAGVITNGTASCRDFYGFNYSVAAPLTSIGNLYVVPVASSATYPH